MPSHSHSHSRRKAKTQKMLRRNKKMSKKVQHPPQAPGELDAMLGYGTSSSFPLFTAGVASRVKNIFGRKRP